MGGGESLTEKTTTLFTHMFLILSKKWNTLVANVKLQCLEQKLQAYSFDNLLVEDLSPPSVHTDVIHVIMSSPLRFFLLPFLHTASDQKLDGGKPGRQICTLASYPWEQVLLA